MKLARVVGTVVSSHKLESLWAQRFLLLQPVDEHGQRVGAELVAVDTVQAGEGDLVMWEGSKEAAQTLPNWFNPCDAAVIGIVDGLDVEG
ncbi:MAG: EutN/CcmL family microcompartment protein [Sphaerochaeta sp.]|jgi:microcompartment protein CcmK/EutM|nr:EutN/CcmL family microcompartment protein [Sphaerochaeta sp.]MDX9914516.1 EutN/CcmL family microcompartment protein [Sphaerochaeta sp.]